MTFELKNGFNKFSGKQLQQWKTTEFEWFYKTTAISVDSNTNQFTVEMDSMSIITVTTMTTGSHKVYPIPDRFQFPIPYTSTFDYQSLGEPGKRLSDLYGAFDVNVDPVNDKNYVLKQAAPVNPGKNAWGHRFNSLPITTFPSGTNWLNYNISSYVFADSMVQNNTVRLCGRIPIWEPSGYTLDYSLGVCLSLEFGTGKWSIKENTMSSSKELVKVDTSNLGGKGKWIYMSLGFDDDKVQGIIGDFVTSEHSIKSLTGVSGIGSDWGYAYFDNVTLELNKNHKMTPNGSFILDCLVGDIVNNSFDGWVGFVLSMENAKKNMGIKQLGRFKVPGSKNVHDMNIIQVMNNSKYRFLWPKSFEIDMSSCVTDLNGFCYTDVIDNSVDLMVGETYFIVSKESKGGDYFVNMTDPATGTTHSHRDGKTYMSYLAPNKGLVTGRVLFNNDTQKAIITQEVDTSYGPLNFVIN